MKKYKQWTCANSTSELIVTLVVDLDIDLL